MNARHRQDYWSLKLIVSFSSTLHSVPPITLFPYFPLGQTLTILLVTIT